MTRLFVKRDKPRSSLCLSYTKVKQNVIKRIYGLNVNCYFFIFSAHPYLFFNPDQHTMTFIGFNMSKFNRSLVDQQTGLTLVENIVSEQLWDALQSNKVPLQENFDDLTRYSNFECMQKWFYVLQHGIFT